MNKLQMLISLIYCAQNINHVELNMHLLLKYPNLATLRDLASNGSSTEETKHYTSSMTHFCKEACS